jgi:hypothetical protein
MQSKLTLRLDEDLIREAKALARQRGTSLLVADYFRALSRSRSDRPEDEELPPLTRALAGALRGADVDEEDYRAHLDRKHR